MQIEIFPNQMLHLEVKAGAGRTHYAGHVAAIKGSAVDLEFDTLSPDDAETLVEADLRIIFTNPSGICSIPARFEKTLSQKPHVVARIQLLFGRAHNLQRRDYFRLRTKEAVGYLPHLALADGELQSWRDAISIDLSGNGMALRTNEVIPVGVRMSLRLFLSGRARPINIEAEVISVSKIAGHADTYRLGAHFLDINEGERRQIVGYLNSLQTTKAG
jgi:c-di-GMP-binding flagellar brake protein YcgR